MPEQPIPTPTSQPPAAKPASPAGGASAGKGEKIWLLWGLIGFTVILLITAVVLFLQLRKPAEEPAPRVRPTPTPAIPPVQEVTGAGVCETTFTVTGPTCTGVTIDPTGTSVSAGDDRELTAEVTGGSGTYTHEWTITSDGADEGDLSSTTANPTTWTAPGSLDESQSWTITDTITDAVGEDITTSCSVILNFTGLVACFDTCDTDLDCEEGLSCTDVAGTFRCVDANCPEDVDCSCADASPSPSPSVSPSPGVSPSPTPPGITQASPSPRVAQPELPEAGFSAPLVIGVAGGILLVILGLLF